MRIAQLTPGSGDNFYCENCLRDAALVTAMRKLEHDILLIPMYLPLQINEKNTPTSSPIFFGGINVYLQQKTGLFRKTPRWLDKLLDNPKLLELVSRKAGMTNAKELAETTKSMLLGRDGRQVKELDRLLDWLSLEENKPDAVSLSNILLLGLAKPIKEKLGIAVVSLLQDEEGFLDGLGPPYAQEAWDIVAECSKYVDKFVSVSQYYADVIQKKLALESERISVVRMGIAPGDYQSQNKTPQVPTIGYLSRMCPEKGLDILVDAFIKLKKNEELKNARLRIAGGKNADDNKFIESLRKKLSSKNLLNDVEFLHDFDRATRLEFLKTLSVLSVPERNPVAYGLYVLESLASSVPVVQPKIGVFPELQEYTQGGLLCEPNDSTSLAAALESLLLDKNYAQQLGRRGREAVIEKFNIEDTAKEMMRIYKEIIK